MSKREMNKQDYVSLLEQAISSGPVPSGSGTDKFSKAKPVSGMQYRGVTVGGDRILNWEGGDQFTSKEVEDADDIAKEVEKNFGVNDGINESGDEESPISMLELGEDILTESDDEKKEEEEEEEEEEKEMDVDKEIKESSTFNDMAFTDVETQIISRLIKEMSVLEEDDDSSLNDEDISDELGEPDLDLDVD